MSIWMTGRQYKWAPHEMKETIYDFKRNIMKYFSHAALTDREIPSHESSRKSISVTIIMIFFTENRKHGWQFHKYIVRHPRPTLNKVNAYHRSLRRIAANTTFLYLCAYGDIERLYDEDAMKCNNASSWIEERDGRRGFGGRAWSSHEIRYRESIARRRARLSK